MTAAEGLVHDSGNTSEEVKADDEIKIDKNAQIVSPVEESDEAVTAKVLPSPSPPSRQEMLEHNITHAIQELVSPLPVWQSEVGQAHAGCRSGSQRNSNHQHGLHAHGRHEGKRQ